MSAWRIYGTSRPFAEACARHMTLRPDMAEAFRREGHALPPGPIWTVMKGDQLVGMGGLEPRGAATSLGWLLVADGLSARDWAMGRRAMASALGWARCHGIKRVVVVATPALPGARRLLERLGFRATGPDDDGDLEMTMELG